MSQLPKARSERGPSLDPAFLNANETNEAEHQNEEISDDAKTSDAIVLKLEALKSYIGATQQHQSYINDWLYHGNDSYSNRTSRSASPRTVIDVDSSSDRLFVKGKHSPENSSSQSIVEGSLTSLERAAELGRPSVSVLERLLRPKSKSPGRDEITSPRSQRPRSPSPERQQFAPTVTEDGAVVQLPLPSSISDTEEAIYRPLARPPRPRSPSPVRVISPSHDFTPNNTRDQDDSHSSPSHSANEQDAKAAGKRQVRSEQVLAYGVPFPSRVMEGPNPRGLQPPRSQPTSEAKNETTSHPRPLFRELPNFDRDVEQTLKPIVPNSLQPRKQDLTTEEQARSDATATPSPLRGVFQPPEIFAPLRPTSSVLFPPPPMVSAVYNLAHSLAGTPPRRRFSEPPRSAVLHDHGTQADEDSNSNSHETYIDSSTQTSDIWDDSVKNPRVSAQSIGSLASNASKGTQTTGHSSQQLSTASISSGSLLRQRNTISSFATQKDADLHSSDNSLRKALMIARSEPSPKKPPPNAKSTRISRVLVNPEALSFMRVEHEAYDEHVVVHRILSREDIMRLAELTVDIRDARSKGEEARERMWEQWRIERYKIE